MVWSYRKTVPGSPNVSWGMMFDCVFWARAATALAAASAKITAVTESKNPLRTMVALLGPGETPGPIQKERFRFFFVLESSLTVLPLRTTSSLKIIEKLKLKVNKDSLGALTREACYILESLACKGAISSPCMPAIIDQTHIFKTPLRSIHCHFNPSPAARLKPKASPRQPFKISLRPLSKTSNLCTV
jgi:hypothetical protein